ncbi:MAG: cytochrome c [Devosiaceae bacterium]|nr:cytochrome c [Devosiaceae bacterium]
MLKFPDPVNNRGKNMVRLAGFSLVCFGGFASLGFAQSVPGGSDGYGLGRVAHGEEIAAWNTDIRPDGQGLPAGSGSVLRGEEIYFESCSSCHGDFGEAVGRFPALAGGEGSLSEENPVKTVGSYWPYLSGVFDYIGRTMPYGDARSLGNDDLYAVTAYVLFLNDLVDENYVLSEQNFLENSLPNEGNFFFDDRAIVELPLFTHEPCMSACKSGVEVISRAELLDITPGTN